MTETTNAPGSGAATKPNHLEVAVVTTSGTWPNQGFDTVPINQPVKIELQRAVRELKIKDTSNWVARVGTREINPEQSYADQGLSGKVEIDYGPREGGGGNE